MSIAGVTVRRLRLPLTEPYRLSYQTFREFEPFVVEIADTEGRVAFGDGHVSPGSSAETREGAWAHLCERMPHLIGLPIPDAKACMLADFTSSRVATTTAVTALEVLEDHPCLRLDRPHRLPLLTPIGALDERGIEAEVAAALGTGFTTFKVKVGKDVDQDAERLGWIQQAAAGRAELRVDANRAFSRDDAIRFVRRIDPEGIMLFEQPCDASAWDENAAVAAASDIPVMLDEPICDLADIERAASIPGVAFCKLKLKRFGSLDRLAEGIRHVQSHGMEAVLGDGLGSDLHAWLEACVAACSIRNAGEFNGFLKMTGRMFQAPLPFDHGSLDLPAGFRPVIDPALVAAATTAEATFGETTTKRTAHAP